LLSLQPLRLCGKSSLQVSLGIRSQSRSESASFDSDNYEIGNGPNYDAQINENENRGYATSFRVVHFGQFAAFEPVKFFLGRFFPGPPIAAESNVQENHETNAKEESQYQVLEVEERKILHL
jgi:hypothetical protein